MLPRVSIYSASAGAHPAHTSPSPVRVSVRIVSAGGGGMGSRPNMDFSSTDLPYGLYGGKGGPSCWDTLPAHSCTASDGVTFSWTGHGLVNDQPVFVTGSQSTLWYVYAPTANTFQLSTNPYTAPGVVT